QYEKLIEVFLNTSGLLAFVWVITKNYVKAFDALLDKYEDMGEQLEVLAQHRTLFDTTDNAHLKTVLEMIYMDILDFHAKALSYFRQKSMHFPPPLESYPDVMLVLDRADGAFQFLRFYP
ncbi:hypothetical protein B0H67DRAFT_489845, partial [Lasiosphaeris hirsuta]